MSAKVRRRRAFLLLSLALAAGGLAASEVASTMHEVEAAVGAPVGVLVTARDLPAGHRLRRADVAVRDVPERFVPPDALTKPEEVVSLPVSAPLVEGAYVTASTFAPGPGAPDTDAGVRGLRPGERAVEVAVAGAGALAAGAAPGSRVDVLVSTEASAGPGRTLLALEDVELLDLRSGAGALPGGPGAATGASGVAILRVTLRQAVYLTAAQNFAREVRILVRPPGDRSRVGRAEVTADGL